MTPEVASGVIVTRCVFISEFAPVTCSSLVLTSLLLKCHTVKQHWSYTVIWLVIQIDWMSRWWVVLTQTVACSCISLHYWLLHQQHSSFNAYPQQTSQVEFKVPLNSRYRFLCVDWSWTMVNTQVIPWADTAVKTHCLQTCTSEPPILLCYFLTPYGEEERNLQLAYTNSKLTNWLSHSRRWGGE